MSHRLEAGIAATLAAADARMEPRQRPYITLAYAQSLDGSIAARPGQRLQLSGPASQRLTHQLRAAHDGILIGIGTLLADDPRLTVRLTEGENPQPIIVDSRLRCPPSATLVRQHPRRPWLATRHPAEPARRAAMLAAGVDLIELPGDTTDRVDLAALMAVLVERGIRRLMVEGGSAIITSLLGASLVDQLVLTIVPRLIGGLPAIDRPPSTVCHEPRLINIEQAIYGQDLVLRADLDWRTP
jgi:3,4-dihydroxy 2-butanone 4-phosphate synthase/GTP cyclohydrolase II